MMTQSICSADFTFLGPTPYLSALDSPFPVDGSNPNFFLEDFEPDEPCIPGGSTFCGAIPSEIYGVKTFFGGGGIGSSVDADDGVIDGSGAGGVSAAAAGIAIIGNASIVGISIEFDADELGFVPTAVGFVLTDGAGEGSGLSVYDINGNRQDHLTSDIMVTASMTSDDRFIGVTNSDGILKIEFVKRIFESNPTAGPRIDHLQYGFLIPEPSTIHLLILGAVSVSGVFFSRMRRKLQ
jgi:hypothetical protein